MQVLRGNVAAAVMEAGALLSAAVRTAVPTARTAVPTASTAALCGRSQIASHFQPVRTVVAGGGVAALRSHRTDDPTPRRPKGGGELFDLRRAADAGRRPGRRADLLRAEPARVHGLRPLVTHTQTQVSAYSCSRDHPWELQL